MNTGFPSYAGSPWVNRCDDYSPDSGFNSAYSSTFGSTGSRLGSSQDVEIHGGPKFGEFIHGKSPSWPVTQVLSRPSPGHVFPSSRSTSWPGQMKTENDIRFNASGVAGEKCRDGVLDATSPGDRTGNSWCDFVSRATHTEETVSPESARRIFREATVRNERVRSDRYSASFLNSTPEKSNKVFLRPSPSVVERRYVAGSRASGHGSVYGDATGGSSTSSLRESNNLSSCRRRITLPRENTSSYETLICPQSIPEPNSDDVDSLSTAGAMGQFGLRNQMYHGKGPQTDWQNNNMGHRVSGTPSDPQVQSGLNGKHSTTGSVRDFNQPCLSKLAAPVQLQRQFSDWNQMQVISDHSPVAGPRGLGVTMSAQSGHNNALSQSSQSPKKSPVLMIGESLSTSHNDPDISGDVASEKVSSSGTPMLQQIERLSLSRTSMLRKLSHEFYGQSAKHGSGLANHAILRTKRYRRFGSVDEASNKVPDNHETLPLSTPIGNSCQSDADLRSRFLKACQIGNGISPSGAPEGFKTVGVAATVASPHAGSYLPSVPETSIRPVVGQDVKSRNPSETRFQKQKPDERFQKMILHASSDDRNIAVVLPLDSPPPPDLPPRKYRDDLKGMPISTEGQRLDLIGANDDDRFDSAADDYAEQLRRQAKRLSNSHSSIFTQIHSPKVEQVAPIGGHVRKPVDDASQENGSLRLSGCIVTSIHSPRVESGMSPNVSHCESVPHDWHAKTVPSNSRDACSTVFTTNGISESPDIGKLNEKVTVGKTDKTGCSRNLFGSDTRRVGGKSSISDWINSIVEVKNSDKEQWNVSYVRSVSSPENQGFGSKVSDSRKDEKSLSVEKSREKNSIGERNHLDHERNSCAVEATSLYNGRTDSREDREFASKGIIGSGQEVRSSSYERKGLSQERKGAPQERKSMSQERKTLTCRENEPDGEKNSSDHGRKQLNQERGRVSYQGSHSNAGGKLLSPGRNSSSDTNKYIQSNQERSLSSERKPGGCERQCLIKKRKDLNHELHIAINGNDINETCHVEKCRSPEKKSLNEGTESPSRKGSSSVKGPGLDFSCDEVSSGCPQNVKDGGKSSEVDLKCGTACDVSVTDFVKKVAPQITGKQEFSDSGSRMDSSVLHVQRSKSTEKISKMVNAGNDAKTHRDCRKEGAPAVMVTEAKLVISTGCTTAKPLNPIVKMVPARNPIFVCDSDVCMTEITPVHSSLAVKGAIREKRAEPFADAANIKPVSAICEKDSTVKVSLLSSGHGAASSKIQNDLNPACSHFKEEIPSFLSDVLPIEHKTATYYLARLSFNNILSRNVECESSLPAVRPCIEPYLRYLTEKAVARSSSSEKQESSRDHSKLKQLSDKDELLVLRKIDDKLKDFERERQSIEKEAFENVALGQKLNSLAEEKLEPREFGKYKIYVDEMDKVLCLLLNVTKRLSSVETSIKSLPIDGSANERSALVSKRDDLSQKYEDALALSEGIALRRPQVNDYLAKSLTVEEFKSFEHFVEAKLRLFLEKQVVEDVIAIVRTRLQSLNSSGVYDCDGRLLL